ncbi:MAG: hypothetical protein WAW60_01350 [Candidatus Saccharimonadales bacterium]
MNKLFILLTFLSFLLALNVGIAVALMQKNKFAAAISAASAVFILPFAICIAIVTALKG